MESFDLNMLIGEPVINRKSHRRGTITDITKTRVFVAFYGDTVEYPFPRVFSSTLMVQDRKLQEYLESMGSDDDYEAFRNYYTSAINSEIRYLRRTGGTKYHAVDGDLLYRKGEEYYYSFDTDTEMHLPDGTGIRIRRGEGDWQKDTADGVQEEQSIYAYIVACEDFSIIFRCAEFLGQKILYIEFTAEQWMLLEALNERLTEVDPQTDEIAYELACKGMLQLDFMGHISTGQNAAFRKAAEDPITIVWGPPGTGKTHTLADISLDNIEQGNRVLMLSYSNVSVDGALLAVANKADMPPGTIIRYGYPRKQELLDSDYLTSFQFVMRSHPDLSQKYQELVERKRKLPRDNPRRDEINKQLNQIRKKIVDEEKSLIHRAAFVATTVSKAVSDKALYTQKFDIVIFDEASMAYIPQVIFAASLAKKHFICLGDFCQLPAIVSNPEDRRLSKDIFEYTGITEAVANHYAHNWLVLLNIQYRMHKDISDFASHEMYQDQIVTAEKIRGNRQEIAALDPLPGNSMGLIDLSGSYSVCIKTGNGSHFNLLSALIDLRLAEILSRNYKVGIISPYNAQSRFVLACIRDLQEVDPVRYAGITSATVHQFQGSEMPIIIYDAVDCYRMQYAGSLLSSMKENTANRLFNVALTRTQGKFLLCANVDFLKAKRLSRELMFVDALKEMVNEDSKIEGQALLEELSSSWDSDELVMCGDILNSWSVFLQDIMDAQKTIHIDIPDLIDDDDEKIHTLVMILRKQKGNGVRITIRTEEEISLPGELEQFHQIGNYITNPVTVIDRSVIWFGQPLAAPDFIVGGEPIGTEIFPCLRFVGIHAARFLQTVLEIKYSDAGTEKRNGSDIQTETINR